MEQLMDYVKPELIVVSVALYFIGMWLKQAAFIKNKYIPLVLGIVGIFICGIWVIGTSHYYEAGNCNGSIHRDCARRIGGRPEYICESVYQAIGKRRVKYNKYGAKTGGNFTSSGFDVLKE